MNELPANKVKFVIFSEYNSSAKEFHVGVNRLQ